jgi:predicted nucleic acid-binding protein
VTVLDTSALVDYLLGVGVFGQVADLLEQEQELAAPELIVFETLAVLRRETNRKTLADRRAQEAVLDLGDLPVSLFPALPLRSRAWELRSNLTAADAIFVALAERLDEPLATKDSGLASAVARHSTAAVHELVAPTP